MPTDKETESIQFERFGYRSAEKFLDAFLNRRLGIAPLFVTDNKPGHYEHRLLRTRQVCACISGLIDIEEVHVDRTARPLAVGSPGKYAGDLCSAFRSVQNSPGTHAGMAEGMESPTAVKRARFPL